MSQVSCFEKVQGTLKYLPVVIMGNSIVENCLMITDVGKDNQN